VRSVQGALEGIAGVTDINLDAAQTSGKFTAPASLDVKMTLDKLVEGGNEHLVGWKMVE